MSPFPLLFGEFPPHQVFYQYLTVLHRQVFNFIKPTISNLIPHSYAFITYGTKEEADQAKQMMNGTTVCGQEIKVKMMMMMMMMIPIPHICHFFSTYAIFGLIFLHTKVRKSRQNRFRDKQRKSRQNQFFNKTA